MDASSPTVKTESVILTSIIDADESRFVGVYDIPGAFLHSKLDEVVHMRVTGSLAKYLEAIAPDVYGSYITIEKDKEVIYLLLTRALYGCLKSALQFWKASIKPPKGSWIYSEPVRLMCDKSNHRRFAEHNHLACA
jgi:hypothetical protein